MTRSTPNFSSDSHGSPDRSLADLSITQDSTAAEATPENVTAESVTADNVTVTNCDREQIHIPGAIQPHGILLVMRAADLRIVVVSDNTEPFCDRPPQAFLDTGLDEWVSEDAIAALHNCLAGAIDAINPIAIELPTGNGDATRSFDGIVHVAQKNVILELEPSDAGDRDDFFLAYKRTKAAVAHLQSARSLQDLCDSVVRDIRQMTGFDRVMVYRFDDDGSGNVIAEDKSDVGTPYRGLRYPESDIPKQARRLYVLNPIRLIPNINYQPVHLVGSDRDSPRAPVDMSFCTLRSVSPIHVEYLQNMGVTASMSVSLIDRGKLWGLIACHHNSPKYVPYQLRTVCEFLGQVVSVQLANRLSKENLDERLRLKQAQAQLLDRVSQIHDIYHELPRCDRLLLDSFGATGAAVYQDGDLATVGDTPDSQAIAALVDWIEPQLQESLFVSHRLPQVYDPAREFKAVGSGVMLLSVASSQRIYVLWFRPEVVQTVRWAGDPNKPRTIEADGSISLSPRDSFEAWQDTVQLQSLPWQLPEREGALELRGTLVGVVLEKARELDALNNELARRNDELDAFAYIVSHDLKEPLRGIHHYANFLLEDYEERLDEEGTDRLETLVRLSDRMEELLDALLRFSRLGRQELQRSPLDWTTLVREVEETLRTGDRFGLFEIDVPRPLPPASGDRALILEVLTNLCSNGLKYNRSDLKRLTVGYLETPEQVNSSQLPDDVSEADFPVFYVRDNGIGVRERHFETVFKIFKRLHGRDRFGGGTGAGLTIVRRIVERHGGKIWLRSRQGEGTTVLFSLPAPAAQTNSSDPRSPESGLSER